MGQDQTSHSLYYYCWTGGTGGTWTYLKDVATGKAGWIRDDLLQGNDSNRYCGF